MLIVFGFNALLFVSGIAFGGGHWIVGIGAICASLWCLHERGLQAKREDEIGRQM